ncbi:hypothetical protein [Olivibacter sitiensis]|uniref:hypothetical protein n=1 Tax=Olivibacter sitiensis TaxID=376470 RepID=UPI000422F056|nr:hypothetical protein [Olivibacter sitiensis]
MNAIAQEDEYVGSYNGSRPELAFQLYILPEQDFVVMMSYGAVDRIVIGKWEKQGDGIFLKEEQAPQPPFLVYQAKGDGPEKVFSFHNFDQNTTTAFRLLEKFNADSLVYIHLPDETRFSRSNILNVPENSTTTFFISRNLTEDDCEVYEFELDKGYESVSLYYNYGLDEPPFEANAILKDHKLYLTDSFGDANPLGSKNPLPEDYKDLVAEAKAYTAIPDSFSDEQSDVKVTYYLLKPKNSFKSALHLDANRAYFRSQDDTYPPSSQE